MKTLFNHRLEIHRYESPRILAIDIDAGEILCASTWNDGTVSDEENNWNIIEL